jgi:putative peptidoglycan lipid II flippase
MGGAGLVAAGILLSRLAGLVRGRILAHYLGAGAVADVLTAATRIPNLLQNLFGEGVLSASFIPVYARLVSTGDDREAGRVASAIGALLALTSTVVVLVGIVAAPLVVTTLVGGFTGEKRELTIQVVRIMFPGVGLLVMSAWCLGVLNSHQRFFLSYASPVLWNAAIIAAVAVFGRSRTEIDLVVIAAWATVAGSALQFAIQVPTVLRLQRHLRFGTAMDDPHVRAVLRSFVPVFIGRGVVQLSAYVDQWIASYLVDGAVLILGNAQVLGVLPVSLFGMAISAAELPALSAAAGAGEEAAAAVRARLEPALRRVAFLIVPSAVAFLALGDVLIGAVFQGGRFHREDSLWAWAALAGSAVGLLAGAMGRLFSSAWYALRDTRTPLNYAIVRVSLTLTLGYVGALLAPGWLGIDGKWGVAGLTASAGIAAWVECTLLRRGLEARIGRVRLGVPFVAKLWGAAVLAVLPTLGIRAMLPDAPPLLLAALTVPAFGAGYFGISRLLGIPYAAALLARVVRPR